MIALAIALVICAALAVYALRLWLDFCREERPPKPVVYSNLDELVAEQKKLAERVASLEFSRR